MHTTFRTQNRFIIAVVAVAVEVVGALSVASRVRARPIHSTQRLRFLFLAFAIATFATISVTQSAVAEPANQGSRPNVANTANIGVFIGCDGNGDLIQYHGNGVQLPKSTTLETYFTLLDQGGSLHNNVGNSNLRTSSTGTLTSPIHSVGSPGYAGAQFNVYWAYPHDQLWQSVLDQCLAGCRVAMSKVRNGVVEKPYAIVPAKVGSAC